MRIISMLVMLVMSLESADLSNVIIRGNYTSNADVMSYINDLPNYKIRTVTDMAYTLWQESRNKSSGNIEKHYNLVASVIVNRSKLNNKRYGKTIYTVIHTPKQFSCWSCNGKTQTHYVNSDHREFRLALEVAFQYVMGYKQPIPHILYYHALYVKPTWSKNKTVATRFGGHIFYL